jgi:hypothetical protein
MKAIESYVTDVKRVASIPSRGDAYRFPFSTYDSLAIAIGQHLLDGIDHKPNAKELVGAVSNSLIITSQTRDFCQHFGIGIRIVVHEDRNRPPISVPVELKFGCARYVDVGRSHARLARSSSE